MQDSITSIDCTDIVKTLRVCRNLPLKLTENAAFNCLGYLIFMGKL